jgi:hypothetical protein
MQEIVQSGDIVIIMLAVVLVEAAVLIGYRASTGRGVPPRSLLINLGAGGSLMFALGATLKGFDWQVTASFLVVAGAFHFFDVRLRWE